MPQRGELSPEEIAEIADAHTTAWFAGVKIAAAEAQQPRGKHAKPAPESDLGDTALYDVEVGQF